MPRLTPELLATRLALDHRVTTRLDSPHLSAIDAYASEADLRAGRRVGPADAEAGRATLYVVEYALPVLVGPGRTHRGTRVRFDLHAGGNYPHTPPAATVVSRPLPWSPHVHPSNGVICIGTIWQEGRGRMLLAHLLVHVLRAFNCDEVDHGGGYVGWNAEAIGYWRTVMHRRPLDPDLEYPRLAVEVTHGVGAAAPDFRPLGGVEAADVFTGFRALTEPSPERFDLRPEDAEGDDLGAFLPLGGGP